MQHKQLKTVAQIYINTHCMCQYVNLMRSKRTLYLGTLYLGLSLQRELYRYYALVVYILISFRQKRYVGRWHARTLKWNEGSVLIEG